MKTFSIVSSLSWMAAAAAASGPNTYNEIPDGYRLGNVTWVGNITANGPEVSFTGASFPEIEAQIRQDNSNFTWPEETTDMSLPDKIVDHLSCYLPQFYFARKYYVDQGIEYLKGITGRCHIDAKVCSRISCSYDSGIFFCNDNDKPLQVNCGRWPQYAQDIVNKCTTDDPSEHVKGQQFSDDNWNVIVGYSKC
ncbi:hypothetical protein GGR53DRAFT_471679 [Hypoxylon sp. FL1150]|nr:hypothetical protein GGR53DRAFT_471679 [Hypoxylon sp. FL1150]